MPDPYSLDCRDGNGERGLPQLRGVGQSLRRGRALGVHGCDGATAAAARHRFIVQPHRGSLGR